MRILGKRSERLFGRDEVKGKSPSLHLFFWKICNKKKKFYKIRVRKGGMTLFYSLHAKWFRKYLYFRVKSVKHPIKKKKKKKKLYYSFLLCIFYVFYCIVYKHATGIVEIRYGNNNPLKVEASNDVNCC